MTTASINTPAPTRAKSPATSYAAAASVVTGQQRLSVLTLLRDAQPGGLTDDEMRVEAEARQIPMSRSGSSTRRIELVRMGMVQDSGVRRPTPFGRSAIVWEITPAGIDELS